MTHSFNSRDFVKGISSLDTHGTYMFHHLCVNQTDNNAAQVHVSN